MASANAEEPKRYGAQGNSQARSASKASAISLFEKFRVSDPQITTLLPNAFDYLEEGVLCDREVWEMLAHWILHVYENKTLKGSSAVNTLRTLMVMVSAKFEANGAPCTHTHTHTQTHAHARTHTRTHTHTHTHTHTRPARRFGRDEVVSDMQDDQERDGCRQVVEAVARITGTGLLSTSARQPHQERLLRAGAV